MEVGCVEQRWADGSRERERASKLWQLTTIGYREGKWQIVIGYKGEGEVNVNERLSGKPTATQWTCAKR